MKATKKDHKLKDVTVQMQSLMLKMAKEEAKRKGWTVDKFVQMAVGSYILQERTCRG